jgi:hypothetical protein
VNERINYKQTDHKVNPKQYEYGIVAYFDILGFKKLVKTGNNLVEILTLLEFMGIGSISPNVLPMGSNVSGIVFSDSFVRVIKQDGARNLCDLAMAEIIHIENIQRKIFQEFGLPLRGSITIGQIFIDGSIVVGPGLVRAIELESSCTKRMPVVVLDHNVTNLINLKNTPPKTLEEASHFINTSNPMKILNYARIQLNCFGIDGTNNNDDVKIFLQKHKTAIIKKLKHFEEKPDILEKYLWLARYHNNEVEKYQKFRDNNHNKEYWEDMSQYLIQEISKIDLGFQTWQ